MMKSNHELELGDVIGLTMTFNIKHSLSTERLLEEKVITKYKDTMQAFHVMFGGGAHTTHCCIVCRLALSYF